MNKFMDGLKWVVYQGFFIGLLWFGWQEDIKWCQNVFTFLTWAKVVLGVSFVVLLSWMKGQMSSGALGIDGTRKFYVQVKDRLVIPRPIPIIVGTCIASFLAAYGSFTLATACFFLVIINEVCHSISLELKDISKDMVWRFREQNTVRPSDLDTWDVGAAGERIPNPDDVFTDDDDNELFRMGITTREREE